MTEMKH
jgi:TolA-binding protein